MVSAVDYMQAQRARGKLIREIRDGFTVDAFIGNATDWDKVCMGNLVGLPVIVLPTGFKNIPNPTIEWHPTLNYNHHWHLCSTTEGPYCSGAGNGISICHRSPQTAATN
ncbi:hypothetical protein Scep_018374 [Stephania cephalantha]|uniref:Amidase n=1 Tax=Stephania cephalantha TaxID=152367 RepID=A0AAP0NXV4_9MAGN